MSLDAVLADRLAGADAARASLLRRPGTTVQRRQAAFWPRHVVLEVVVHLPHHPQLFRYADDGETATPLDSAGDVSALSAREHIELDEAAATDYVRLLLATSDVALVERDEDLRWVPGGAVAERRAEIAEHVRPIVVTRSERGLLAVAAAVEGRDLVRVELELDRRGRVLGHRQQPLAADLPIAYRA